MSGRNSHSTEDIGWRFGIAIDGSRKQVQCKFCSKVIRGGITRLKQHLAHKTGDVALCPDVSAEVKRDMMKLLTEYKEKKRQKTRIARDLEDEITRSFNRNDYVDDEEEEDAQLAHARYESLEQHRFEHEQRVYRASRGAHFDEGGSSRPPSVPQMRRSATVRESSSRASRDMAYEQMSTPSARLRAVEVELEKDRTRTKQSKVNTSWLKAAKNKMIKAFGSWVIDTNVPFAVVDSIYTNPLLETIREVGPDVRAPSSYELSDVFLPEAVKEIRQWISEFAPKWKERGVTIMCDGWSSMTRLNLINFLIYSNGFTVFHKSVNASDVQRKDADYLFKLMKKVVEEVGPEKVVQIVTDNAAPMKAAGRTLMEEFPNLYWTPCAAHCLDLILEDFAKLDRVGEVIKTARMISNYIYKYDWAVNYMKKFTNNRDIIRPGITRFAINFVSLESLVRHKTALRDMWESPEWLNSRLGKSKDATAKEVRQLILSSTKEALSFWKRADEVLKLFEPIVKVLRLVDGDDKPTMGFIYEAMERTKLAIDKTLRYSKRYEAIIDKRWNFLHTDLHAAGIALIL